MAVTTFVGRDAERETWRKCLEDEAGHAVLIVGPAGMGKTALMDQMVREAREHSTLRRECIRYRPIRPPALSKA